MDLALTLLGETKFSLNGKPIKNLSAVKAYALLIYLVADSHHAHRRDALAEMFWPNKPEGYGRNNLKQTLSILRTALGDRQSPEPFIISSNRDLQFNNNSDFRVDLLEFEALAKKVQKHCHSAESTCENCAALLDQAASLYKDDFLVDFYLSDSPDFNEWVLTRRESSKRLMADILGRLINCYQEERDYKNGVRFAKKLVDLEPWSESNHRRLMALLAASGKRSAALKQFHACEAMLASEFNVQPTPDTISLYETIKNWKPENGKEELNSKISAETSPGKKITELVQEETSKFKYWVMGSLSISLFVLIWFGTTRWIQPNSPSFGENPKTSDSSNPVQANPEGLAADPIQVSDSPAPEVLMYLQGDDPNFALAALYDQTRGSDWTQKDGWLENSSPCTWFGITCQDKKIIEIRLPNNNLAGSVPPQIGDMLNIKVLDLSNNLLKGPIPPEIGTLVKLEYLNLEGNFEISGEIPPEISNLQNLKELILSSASAGGSLLDGNLPIELGDLIKLDKLIIEDTLIEGSIPPHLGKLSKLSVLSLAHNNLSGPIPDEIYDLSKLRSLDLWSNKNLGGTLSSKIGKLTNLDFLNISDNQFSGNLPAELGTMKNLDWIGLHDNPFEGALPRSMIELNPSVFQFENTNLCEPADAEYQDWLDTISELSRTSEICDEKSTAHEESTLITTENYPYPISSKPVCLPGETLIYQEDFQDDQLLDWPELHFRAQGWEIVSDPLSPKNLAVHHTGDQDADTDLQDLIFKNSVFRIWIKKSGTGTAFLSWNSSTPPQESELVFLSYQMEIHYKEDNQAGHAMYRVEWPEKHVTVGSKQVTIPDNTWVLYEVFQYQDQTVIRVDNTEIISYRDPYPLPPGEVGFEVWSSENPDFQIYFDRISICRITGID